MEGCRELDLARNSVAGRLIGLLALLLLSLPVLPQTASNSSEDVAAAEQLARQEKWEDLLRRFPPSLAATPEIDFYRGIALAHLGQLEQAKLVLTQGFARAPRDKRFPIELAGVAYQQKQFAAAKSDLSRALELDPGDAYVNNFLASIFFLEGNLEAALKYWNRLGKPRLADLSFDPQPRAKPILLDRAFQFSLGEQWTVADYLKARARIENLGIFTRQRFDLGARTDGSFDLTFRAFERRGWGTGALEGALSLLRELPYQGVAPEFYNLGGSALNWMSLVRWDAQKRRLASEVSAPLGNDPSWRFRLYFDGRNENWDISRVILTPVAPAAGVNVERAEAGAEIRSVINGRWSWTSRIAYSYRRYRNLSGIPPQAARFFEDGSEVRYQASLEHALWRLPERRLTLDTTVTAQFGTHFASSLGAFSRLGGSLRLQWLPRARGDDDEIETLLRAGRTFGRISFDELAMLGFERDNDLWLRGHAGTRDGKKGNAPLGTNYLLWNLDYARKIYRGGFLTVRAGPFLDCGRITEPSKVFGSPEWLCDTGFQFRLRVLSSFEFILGYGRDLRAGHNAFISTVAR